MAFPGMHSQTFPRAETLNRFATDFRVLIPLGRRIIFASFKKSAHYRFTPRGIKRYFGIPRRFTSVFYSIQADGSIRLCPISRVTPARFHDSLRE